MLTPVPSQTTNSYGGHYVPAFAHYLLRKNDALPPVTTTAPTPSPSSVTATPAPTPSPTPSPTPASTSSAAASQRLRGQTPKKIQKSNPVYIPLRGVGIGDGLTNPALQVGWMHL